MFFCSFDISRILEPVVLSVSVGYNSNWVLVFLHCPNKKNYEQI